MAHFRNEESEGEKMYKPSKAIFVLLTLALLLGACLPGQQPAQQVQNTQPSLIDVQAQISTSVAQTIEAQNQIGTFVAQTVEAQPSPIPTATLIPTFTPFALTTVTITPWAGGGAGGGGGGSGGGGGGSSGSGGPGSPQYDCDVVAQKPRDGDRIWRPGTSFDVVWTLKNTGTKKIPADAYFVYRDYTNFSPTPGFVIGHTVAPGDTFSVRVEAVAPSVSGTDKEQFTMRWMLVVLGNKICNPYIGIFVQRQ
jgi:hypothetical protein